MSIQLMSAVYNVDLPSSDKFVLLMLADHANPNGYCFPSQKRLARHPSLSVRTVQYAIQRLVKGNWIKIVKEPDGRGKSTEYLINLEKVAMASPFNEKGCNPDHKGRNLRQKRVQPLHSNHKEPPITKRLYEKPVSHASHKLWEKPDWMTK